MKSIKHILVPVDFGEVSANAYEYALQLAGELSASVHLLHCLPAAPVIPGNGHVVLDTVPQLHQRAKEQIADFAVAGKANARWQVSQMPEVTTSISAFGLKEGITQYVMDHEVGLIVMGTHGVQDAWDRFFGTNATFLVGKVKPPILVLPLNARYQALKTICFATGLRESDLVGAGSLRKALSVFDPQINYLHVHLPDDPQTSDGLDLFRRAFEQPRDGVEATFITTFNEDVTDGIFNYLNKHPHDLLVMIKLERGWWDRMFAHSDTRESAGVTNLPLLILGQ
ncbi:universal stress protein [Neolewinella agarilytica]|uniref:Nucleotide-binding universal stress protein, UspA family n=1 Tax=Neolewinella agarilytica TaxID=478744 RepID=A0A1H9KWP5_9BACT|nr:universal stress protein [Neolewinella agarilytica]SER03641.1 Nucleotide-binding universal stress protein, UspA family [Neolewinella agarilytica]